MADVGRPKGSTNKKVIEEAKQPEIDMQEMIAKAVAMALAENEKKHAEEIENIKKQYKPKPSINEIQVEIKNNTFGVFIIGDRKGKASQVFYRLPEHGDTTLVDYADFRAYYSQNSKFFKSGELIISDVYGDISFDDFIKKLGLTKLYSNKISVKDINSILEADYKDFEEFMNDNDSMIDLVAEYALKAFKNDKFNYGDKQNYFRTKIDVKMFNK